MYLYLNIDFTDESQVASKSFEQYELNYSVKYLSEEKRSASQTLRWLINLIFMRYFTNIKGIKVLYFFSKVIKCKLRFREL